MIRNFDSYVYKKKNELINQYSSRIIHELSRGKEIKETVIEFFLNFVDKDIFSEAVAGNQQGQPQKKIFIGGHQKDIIEIIRSTIGSLKDIYSHDIGKNPKATNLANTYIMFANNVGKKLIDAVPNILMTAAQNVSKIIAQPKPAAQAAGTAQAGADPAGQAPADAATAGTPAATPQDLTALESIFTSGTARATFARMSQEDKNTFATALAGLTPEEKAYFNSIRNYDNKLKFLRKTAADRTKRMNRTPGTSRNRRQQSGTTINPQQTTQPQPQTQTVNPAPNTPNSAFGSKITFQPGMFQTSSYNPMKKGFVKFFESRQARNFINETAREFINNSNNVEKLVEEFIQYTKHGSKHSIILESFDELADDVTPKKHRAAQQPATPAQTSENTPSAPTTNDTNEDIGVSDQQIKNSSVYDLLYDFMFADEELLTRVVNKKIELSGGLEEFLKDKDNVNSILASSAASPIITPIITPIIAQRLLDDQKLDLTPYTKQKLRKISTSTQSQSKTATSQPTTAPQTPSESPASASTASGSPTAASGSPPAASGFQYGRETLFGKETLQKTRFTDIGKQVVLNLTKAFNKKIKEMPAIDDKRIFSKIFNQVIKSVENQLRTDLQSTVKELEGKAVGSKDEKYGEVIKGNRKKNFNMIMRGLGYSNPEQFLENLGRQMSAGDFSAIGKEVNSLRTKLSEPRYENNKKLIEEFLKEALGNLDPNEFEKAMRSNSIEGVKDFFKYQAGMLWLAYAIGGELVARYGPSIKSSLMTAANKLGQAGKYIWNKAGSAAIGAGEWLSKMSKKAGDWASRMAETTGLWVVRSQLEFEEALRIFNEAKKQGQRKIMAKISAAVKAAEQAGGAFGQWLAQKRKEQLERMYASDKKNRNTWDEDSMWYDPNAPKPEPKKPSWFSKTAGSAKDWLKGHFTRPVEEEDPKDYVWSGQGKFDNF